MATKVETRDVPREVSATVGEIRAEKPRHGFIHPGSLLPDRVDCCVVTWMLTEPAIAVTVRAFRQSSEPGSMPWRVVGAYIDKDADDAPRLEAVLREVVSVVSDEPCEVFVADATNLSGLTPLAREVDRVGVPLWHRDRGEEQTDDAL